jgi:sugar phosphate isomerase/epimerase
MRMTLSGTELKLGEAIDPLINAARRNGIEWLEVWYPMNTVAAGVEATIERLAREGLRVAAIGTGTELGGEGDVSHHQQTLFEAIEIADRIGCGIVGTYFGCRTVRDDASAIETYVSNVAPCIERAESLGVTLTLENEFDAFGHDPAGSDVTRRAEATVQLVERIGSTRFRLTFDPCNAYFAGLEPFPEIYGALSPFISYVHVKDGAHANGSETGAWTRFTDGGRGYATCALGEGALNWPGILHALARDSYSGFLTIEPHAQRAHRDDAWDASATTLRNWLEATR